MLEQISNAITFYAHYIEDKVGKTGLTVTVDVWEVQTDGTSTEIVSAASATEIGDGLYRYVLASGSVDEEGEYVAVFKTSNTDVDQRDIPSLWAIQRAGIECLDQALSITESNIRGSDSDDLKDISDEIAAVPTAAEVWAYAVRTLTQSAASVEEAVSGSTLTAKRGDTFEATLSGLSLSGTSKVWFTVKQTPQLTDPESTIQIDDITGLLYVDGEGAADPTKGNLVVDGVAGTLDITLDESITQDLTPGAYCYDVQKLAGGTVTTLTEGTFQITSDYTRAIT